MGKLTAIKPRVQALAPRLRARADAQGHDPVAEPWREWYGTRAWAELRVRVFERDGYLCQWENCGILTDPRGAISERPIADHVAPHRGDPALFWDEDNVQTLCKACHDGPKQRQEREGRSLAGGGPSAGSGAMARPSWFRKVHVPLAIVCGPPGAGKSRYVRERASAADLVICFDTLAEQLLGRRGDRRAIAGLDIERIADVLRVRNEMLGDLMRASAAARWPRAWLILTEPEAAHRLWWSNVTGAEIVVLATPLAECRRRIAADAEAGDRRSPAADQSAADWWRRYRPAPCDRGPA